MSNRFTIVVEGIADASLVADIEKTICESFHEIALPGPWRVVVRPSHVSGRWDFRIYGLDVRHTLSIAVPPQLLSSLIPRRFRESLDRSVLTQVEDGAVMNARSCARGVTAAHAVNTVSLIGAPVRTV